MKIRDLKYKGAPAWPPQPAGGAFDPHHPAPIPPDLEEGIVKDVRIVPPYGGFPAHIELEVERPDGKIEKRPLWVNEDSGALLVKLYDVLKGNKGRTLREVGDLEVDI
jgi:hypothetical protein